MWQTKGVWGQPKWEVVQILSYQKRFSQFCRQIHMINWIWPGRSPLLPFLPRCPSWRLRMVDSSLNPPRRTTSYETSRVKLTSLIMPCRNTMTDYPNPSINRENLQMRRIHRCALSKSLIEMWQSWKHSRRHLCNHFRRRTRAGSSRQKGNISRMHSLEYV